MRRREFLGVLGGAAASWPRAARAQQGERMRRVGVLLPAAADDAQVQTWVGAFLQELGQLGRTIGRNVRIDTRWATTNATEIRRHAAELVALAPDVILAHGDSTAGALLQATHTAPIVFVLVADPVGGGLVDNLARPGGNVTGFMNFEYSLGGKWLELLKEVPGVTRVGVLRDAAVTSGTGQFAAIQGVAPSLRMEISRSTCAIPTRSSALGIRQWRPDRNVGRVGVAPSRADHRARGPAQAARGLDRSFVAAGGLVSYGPERIDQFRQAAGYVDRILKGERPADLPVQAPTSSRR